LATSEKSTAKTCRRRAQDEQKCGTLGVSERTRKDIQGTENRKRQNALNFFGPMYFTSLAHAMHVCRQIVVSPDMQFSAQSDAFMPAQVRA
jgi:hypothetical protein